MISKERLRELIENKQTIYYISELAGERELVEHKYNDRKSIYKYLKNGEYTVDDIYDNCWFETEEEATEYLKYGNITRTEKFPYVSWEEVCDGTNHHIVFTTPKHQKVEMIICDGYIDIVIIYNLTGGFNEPLTRENYHKALDICVKLFKGEEV